MQIVKTSQLKERMVTASPVIAKNGRQIADRGVSLTGALIARIAFYDIAQIEVEDAMVPQEGSLKEEPSYSKRVMDSPKFQAFYETFFKLVPALKASLLSISAGDQAPDTGALYQMVEPLLQEAPTSIERFDFLHNMRKIEDSIYAHSLNVALISDMLGMWLKLPRGERELLVAAALLHDIGKTKLPPEVLDKPGMYTDEELHLVRRHPALGYEILLPCEDLDPRVKNAALMHHERCDGSGYPDGLKNADGFAQMIAIADVYDAMTAARPHRTPLCPFWVIADFETDGLQKYNPKYLLTFLEHIAYTYQNNRVLLTDGRSANIIMLNKQFLSLPIVNTDDGVIDLSKTPELRIQALL